MAINANDIKLVRSERMTDNDDGGGFMTADEIVSGDMNNVFPDISRLDRTYGRVNLRKIYGLVKTANTDLFQGAHAAIVEAPEDESVSALLFSTGSHTDERAAAQSMIESYVVRGPVSRFQLIGAHVVGTRILKFFSRVGVPSPDVGDVLCLVEGGAEEFIRVAAVAVETQEYENATCNVFQVDVHTVTFDAPISQSYTGDSPHCQMRPASTLVCNTSVADAARYYGVVDVASAVTTGDLSVDVTDIYQQLVPAARGEAPINDKRAAALAPQTISSGGVDFQVVQVAHTAGIDVLINNQAYTYVYNCQPIPAPGSLLIEYRAQGKWYAISDDGTGQLGEADGEAGSGQISYSTGSVQVTLGALPDINTAILIHWASPRHFRDASGTSPLAQFEAGGTLSYSAQPGSVIFTWLSGGVEKTATSDLTGAITGAADGFINHATGVWSINFVDAIPDGGGNITIDFTDQSTTSETFTGLSTDSMGFDTITLADLPARASISVSWLVGRKRTDSESHESTSSEEG